MLSAWIETDADGQITAAGYRDDSRGLMGATTVKVGAARRTFQAVALPDLRRDPEHGDGWVRFTQTTGGRTGLPAPRRVAHPPFVQWQAPTVWTTLTLTLHADGQAEIGVPGASRFPRHWVYDARRPAGPQVRAHRLRRVVPQVVRQAHAVGRRGLLGDGGRGGVRAGAVAVG